MLDEHLDGALVIRDQQLVGVVTAMDLVFRESELPAPHAFVFLDLVWQVGGRRAEEALAKITGVTVDAIMTTDLVTATPETSLRQIATWMVEKHLTVIPVIDADKRLIGMVTKPALVREVLRHAAS